MSGRGTAGETAGTASANYLTPRAPHRYRARNVDPGERASCTCGVADRRAAIHTIPSPRAAEEETTA